MMAARASPLGGGLKRQWTRVMVDATLWVRTPARAICGSLRAAIIVMAAGFTVFLLSEATYMNSKWNTDTRRLNQWEDRPRRHDYGILIGVDLLVAAANIGLIFGAMTGKLNYLYGWMSMAMVDLFVALAAIFWLSIDMGYSVPLIFLFPLLHFIYQLVLLCLVNGMAHELRGGRFFENSGGMNGSMESGGGDDGWLHHNIALEIPPPPGAGTAKPRSPAVLEPSACTTAPSPAPPSPQPLNSHC